MLPGSDLPEVDFRSGAYAAADGQHSFRSSVNGVDFTVSAFRDAGDGSLSEASIWWDAIDGLGIYGAEDDEIDSGEILVLEFAKTIGISHLFFADLFANETADGLTYDESGLFRTDGGYEAQFIAGLISTWGDAANGEGMFAFDKAEPVQRLVLTASSVAGYHNFALLGFVDPEIPRLSAPATGLMLLASVLLFAAAGRARRAAIGRRL